MKRPSENKPLDIGSRLRGLTAGLWERLDGAPPADCRPAEAGIILIQIDGLGESQLRRALKGGRMPFARGLLSRHGYTLKPFYAGLPSSTPAVQGELFYGVKAAVPAFEFIEQRSGRRRAMYQPDAAATVARRLERLGQGLLKGGAAYANIYSGGAATARYCVESVHLNAVAAAVNPLKLPFVLLFQAGKIARILALAGVELLIALYDGVRGMSAGKNRVKELKLIPTRVMICAVLRELVRFRVKMDVARGVPIVAANFLGYDEQAHRRGPRSAFAHWTLKGIDGVVRDIYRTARRSDCRRYQVIVYADHGQEQVATYTDPNGRDLKAAVRALLSPNGGKETATGTAAGKRKVYSADDYRRAADRLRGDGDGNDRRGHRVALPNAETEKIQVTTMGPLAHVYLPRASKNASPGIDALERMARLLVDHARVPLVLYPRNGDIAAVTPGGRHRLAEAPDRVLGGDHAFLQPATSDLQRLCRHEDAGDLILSGWRPEGRPLSFNIENGAHGGPGREETRGFALLPPSLPHDAAWLRPLDLRELVRAHLGPVDEGAAS